MQSCPRALLQSSDEVTELRPPHHCRGTQPLGAGRQERCPHSKIEGVGAGALQPFGPDGETEHVTTSHRREAPESRASHRANLCSCCHCIYLGVSLRRRGRTLQCHKHHLLEEAHKRAPPWSSFSLASTASREREATSSTALVPCHHSQKIKASQP
jgi:hypothetical protein